MINPKEFDLDQEFEQKVRGAFQIQDPDQAFIDRLQKLLTERRKVIKQKTERRGNWLDKIRLQISPLAWGAIAIILILALVWGIKNLIPKSEPMESTAVTSEADFIEDNYLPTEAITPENVDKLTQLSRWSRGMINGTAWSPDGQTIAVASTTGVYLYDAQSYEPLDTIAIGLDVDHIVYGPKGIMIALVEGSYQGPYVTLYDITNREPERIFSLPTADPRNNITFSTDGRLMAFGYDGSTIKIWDITSGEETISIRGSFDSIGKLIFSNDGATLVSLLRPVTYMPDGTAMYNGDPSIHTVTLWDVSSGKVLRSLENCRGTNMALSPDDNTVIVYRANYISICDLESGTLISKQKIGSIFPTAYSPDGTLMAGVKGSEIKVWDVTAGEELITLNWKAEWLSGMAFSPDGNKLVSASSGSATIWDLNSGQVLHTITGYKRINGSEEPDLMDLFREWMVDIEFSPDGQILAIVSNEGRVILFKIKTGELIAELETNIDNACCITYSPDNKLLAVGGGKYEPLVSSVQIWEVATQEQRLKLDGFKESVLSIAFSPDGSILATGEGSGYGNAGSAKIWDLSTGKLLNEFGVKLSANPPIYWTVYDVAFNPDGSRLAAAAADGGVFIWDVVNQKQVTRLDFDNFVNSVAFSPDGNLLAVAGQSGEGYVNYASDIRLWDIATGQTLFTFEGQDLARGFVFSPDGRILASASLAGKVWLWDVSTGKALAFLDQGVAEIIAFSPDGRLLATGGNTIHLWGIPPSDDAQPDLNGEPTGTDQEPIP